MESVLSLLPLVILALIIEASFGFKYTRTAYQFVLHLFKKE